MNITKIRGVLHYRDDLGEGLRTGIVLDECPGKCDCVCNSHKIVPESSFFDGEEHSDKEYYTASEMIEFIRQEKIWYPTRKVGITFLGKEPLNNLFFCRDVAASLKKSGTSFDLYTCATAPIPNYDCLYGLVDCFYLNLFAVRQSAFKSFNKVNFRTVKETILYLDRYKFPYSIRIPAVEKIRTEEARKLSEFVCSLENYHSVKIDFSASSFSEEEKRKFIAEFESRGVKTQK